MGRVSSRDIGRAVWNPRTGTAYYIWDIVDNDVIMVVPDGGMVFVSIPLSMFNRYILLNLYKAVWVGKSSADVYSEDNKKVTLNMQPREADAIFRGDKEKDLWGYIDNGRLVLMELPI